MLIDETVTELLNAFSAPDPTPGGGSASALAGAVGASLLAMVSALPRTRHGSDDDRAVLGGLRDVLISARDRLATLVDEDATAYGEVVASYRLPKGTDEERAARTAAVQRAVRRATDVPLEVMRTCATAVAAAREVAARGNPSAASDVRVGLELLLAGLRGARENVAINLGGLADPAAADALRAEAAALSEAAAAAGTVARDALTE
jgi:formiminotetrahydrofolate cyclodeaminase